MPEGGTAVYWADQRRCCTPMPSVAGTVMGAAHLAATVLDVLRRAPAWIRTDLSSHDPKLRNRAEEVLATLIATALAGAGDGS